MLKKRDPCVSECGYKSVRDTNFSPRFTKISEAYKPISLFTVRYLTYATQSI